MTRGIRPFLLHALTALALLCFTTHPAKAAQSPLVMQTEDERMVKWDLTADSLTSLENEEVLEAKGNVHLRRGGEYLKADYARYYMSTKWVYLKGHVQVRFGKDDMQAEEAEFDLRSRVGWLKNGRIFMEGPHTYLAGERINKHWGDVYTFKNAKVTTCDGDKPAWSITANEAVVEIDGYARLTGSAFQVDDTPVAYTPYFIMPTKTRRQTGFLTPDYGVSSSKGATFNLPFFWAINESSDLTVNEQFMDKRGWMSGIQYRAKPNAETMAWLRFDWLKDNQTNTDVNSGNFTDDNLVRTNSDRWWLRGMFDSVLPDPNWRIRADLDLISDQDYLSDFTDDFGGFTRTRDSLFDLFHRDLQEKNRDRVSGILITRDWERAGLALSAQYTQNPGVGHGNTPSSEDPTVQRLPQLDAFWHQGRILPAVPLEFAARGQAGYYYRRNGTSGARYEINPRLTLPLVSRLGTIITNAGLRQTLYNTDNPSRSASSAPEAGAGFDNEQSGPKEKNESRSLFEYDIAGFTEFARVFDLASNPLAVTAENVGQSRKVALRHSIQPRVEYFYRPSEDQDDNPYYDSDDRLLPRSELVYSLTNVLTVKREKVVMGKDKDGKDQPRLETDYIDLTRLRLGQSYDFREAVRTDETDTYPRRPFGDIFADLDIYLTDYLGLTTRNYWSPYLDEITSHRSGITFQAPYRHFKGFFGYDYRATLDEYTRTRDQKFNYVTLSGGLDVSKAFNLGASYSYDVTNPDNQASELRLTYTDQCYQLIGRMSIEPQDKSYGLMVVLTGLGDQ